MEKKRPLEDGGRDWNDAATAKECLGPPEAGRDKEGFSLRTFQGSTIPCQHLDFGLWASRAVREHSSIVEGHPRLW